MRLAYFHAVFELKTKNCPGEYWESIVSSLKIVLAVYGHSRFDPEDPHKLHVIFEDDPTKKTYNMLPHKFQVRSKFVNEIIPDRFIPTVICMKLRLFNEPGLCITDNTYEYIVGRRPSLEIKF